jgi:hypothetical protein
VSLPDFRKQPKSNDLTTIKKRMKTTDLSAEINAHISAQLDAVGEGKNEDLRDSLRAEAVAVVKKNLDTQRVVRIARRLLSAKLAQMRVPQTADTANSTTA